MSGHSKWATTKRQKARVDAARGKVFSKIARELIIAAREGGPNPDGNFRLKMVIDKAKAANMPGENIQRAIQRGSGAGEADHFEEVVYEGYGPAGVAVMLEVMTDNRNRTAAEIRHIFDRNGGSLGATGCVAWMFKRRGQILVNLEDVKLSEDDLMMLSLDAGGEDFQKEEDQYVIYTVPEQLEKVRSNLVKRGIKTAEAELTYVPTTNTELSGDKADQAMRLLDLLEEHDDVQQVHANLEVKG
ncbi:MAG TPA: YebC/PmpR family DNA-binding transcriptional regulator [Bacillota bacterium]